jgi:RNA polymerase sigma-70 factor (TIGR02960 family)
MSRVVCPHVTADLESSMSEEHWLRNAFQDHGRALHAHCYRLSGNVPDADDLLQEAFVRAWRSRASFEGRASVRTWLYRIATYAFLDSRKAAARRMVPVGDIFEWSTELGPYPDSMLAGDAERAGTANEVVELALIAALMYLPPRQRAAFVLRDIHGWTPAEIAEVLDSSVATANSLLQRARATVRRHAPADRDDWRRPQLTRSDKDLLRRYSAAREVEDFRALLAEDVRITMPPDPAVTGIEAAARFLGRPLDWHTIASSANGRPALVCYLRQQFDSHYRALVVDVLHVVDGKIAEVNAFVGARHVMTFGLPAAVSARGQGFER